MLIVILAGLWTSRAAYRELRSTKQFYGELTNAVDRNTQPRSVIVFGTWWFDQVVASLYSSRIFLYADNRSTGIAVLRELEAAGIRDAVLAWSREQADDGAIAEVLPDTCYRIAQIENIAQRQVTILQVTCDP